MIYIATDNYNDGFPLSNAYDDTIYQKANAEYYLKFRFPVDRLGIWKHLTCETILKADDTRGLQLFKIKKINKINGYVRVYAKHITDDLNFIGVDKIAVSNATGRRVMEALAGSTTEQHSFIFNSDVATMHTLNLTNTTAGKVLSKDKHSILGQWGGELIRDNFLVDLKARAGVDTEILFMNKKNVKNLDNAISTENITTRLKLSVEVEGEGNNKQTITATVDSPNINSYPRIYTNYLKVNSKTITNQAQLIEYGKKYFRDTLVDFPSDNLTVNVIDRNQERVNLFDTVWFRNVEFEIDKRLKVVAYEFSPMSKRYKKISFGALKVGNLSQIKSLSQLEEKIDEKITESFTDAVKIQQNLSQLLKLDRKSIEDKLADLEEKSKGALEVKKALFEADGTIPEVVKTKILDAVEGDIGRLKTIITEAELIEAIQAKLNFAEIKNALIDKAFINQIISDERFTQQFQDGEVNTQNIFTKLKDSIKSSISKDFVTKDGVRKLVNDLTIDADGIRQITQQESQKIFKIKKDELKGVDAYLHKKYSNFSDGQNMSDDSNLKYLGIYTGNKQQPPTDPSEYSWTKLKSDGRLHKAYANSLTGLDFTLVEPDENAKLFAKNRPRVNIVNDNDISDIWQANMFLSLKPNTKYTLTARAKGNSNKLWAYFRNNKTNVQYNWGQLEFRGLETKSITFTTTNDVDDVLFKFVLVPEDEDWTGVQIDWFTIYEGDKRYSDYPVNEPAQYHKYRYFGYVFKEGQPIASDFDWFDLQQTSITNDKYTHIVYSDNADGSNFGREPKKYMGVARTTSPTQPTNKTAYKWFKVKGDDGVSSYIHRKYSDNANGSPMSDNSNLKYIGIYTGTSATAPTTPTSYTWSKIKGEDGAQGVPGARGSDGRTSYLHTAYSNSATGDRDFSTTNSANKEYIGTYSDFEINDSNDYRRYKWVKIKGENGRDGNNGRDGRNGDSYTRNYLTGTADEKILTAVSDKFVTQEAFRLVDGKAFRDLGFNIGDKVTFIADYEVLPNGANKKISKLNFEWYDDNRYRFWMNQDLNPTKGTFTRTITANNDLLDSKRAFLRTDNVNAKIKITNARVIKGDTVQPWSIAQEDLQGHTISANLWFTGDYINDKTRNVRLNLLVFYDGKEVRDFTANIRYTTGRANDWQTQNGVRTLSDGIVDYNFWSDGEKGGEPLFALATINYKGLQIVCDARLVSVPNIEEVRETIKKYKTFESTLSEFKSEIGYIKETTQVLGDSVPDILKDSRIQTGNDVYFNSAAPLKANTTYTIVANISGLTNTQETGIYGATGNTKKHIINDTNFWVVQFPSEQNRVNFYPLGSKTTIGNVKVYEGDFSENLKENLYVKHLPTQGAGNNIMIQLSKRLVTEKVIIYFDVDGDVNGKKFHFSDVLTNFGGYADVDIPLKNKDNLVSASVSASSFIILGFNYANPTIKNVRVYAVNYAFRKLTKTQTQNIGTVFKQSAEDIIVAWNNYNKYFSFNNETLDILEKDNYQNKYKKISLTSEGLKIYNNNTLIGTIGTFTHLGQKTRENTLDIVLTGDTKAFGIYRWIDNAFGTNVSGYAPAFEIKLVNGLYRAYFGVPVDIRDAYISNLKVGDTASTYTQGITKTINVGGRNLRFIQGILVSG